MGNAVTGPHHFARAGRAHSRAQRQRRVRVGSDLVQFGPLNYPGQLLLRGRRGD